MASNEKHTFATLTTNEIELATKTLKDTLPNVGINFNNIDRQDTPKRLLIPYLEAKQLGYKLPPTPSRYVKTLFKRSDNKKYYNAVIRLNPPEVTLVIDVPSNYEALTMTLSTPPQPPPPLDIGIAGKVFELMLGLPEVKEEITKLNLPPTHSVVAEAWTLREPPNKEEPAGRRRFQGYLFINETSHPGRNHYSIPCSIFPVIDAETLEFVRMEYHPVGDDMKGVPTEAWKPVKAIQYDHELVDIPLRTDPKPYHAIQPQGASFAIEDNLIKWQKWQFRVGFDTREGLFLQNITYDSRNVFYRLSYPEMAISYGDRLLAKQRFDAGDAGWGLNANSLELGCDCLGTIHYFDGFKINKAGRPTVLKNVICIHEQDAGIMHKHTNPFTGAITLARSRQLIVQMICTIGNYEYIFNWTLDQAAGIELEVRATGIMATAPIDNEDGRTYRWGTIVGPGVFAPYHQHIFSMRIDPAVDGHENTVAFEDSVALPMDPISNPTGNAHVTEETVVKISSSQDLDVARHRIFKIRNDTKINPISRKPVSYKLMLHPSQLLLINPSNPFYKQAMFTTKPVWVTEYRDNELYPTGQFTTQVKRDDDLLNWVNRQDNVENKDVVLWHSFGFTHNPRPEDFPIMPTEKVSIALKPSSFFEYSPALDIPRSTQHFNNSTLYAPTNGLAMHEKPTDGCCK